MSARPDDQAKFFEALRRSSAKQLNLDPDNLTAAEATRVDRVCALRVCLDRMTSAQLAGAELDARSYIAASQELEKLLGGDPERPTSAFATHESQLKLRALIEAKLMPIMNAAEEEEAAPASPTAGEEAAAEPEPPPVEVEAVLMPEGTEPPKQPHVSFVEHEPSPPRHSSMNMPTARPTPRVQQPASQVTQSYFSNAPGGSGRTGFRRFDPPSNF